jgi:hypothetical protein
MILACIIYQGFVRRDLIGKVKVQLIKTGFVVFISKIGFVVFISKIVFISQGRAL